MSKLQLQTDWMPIFGVGLALGGALMSGCAKEPPAETGTCAPTALTKVTESQGSALVFYPDPMAASGSLDLRPSSQTLDQYVTPVNLDRLSGRGVLQGTYASVVNGVDCDGSYNAFDAKNSFSYPHSDRRFSEAMTYFFSDQFRSSVHDSGYLVGPQSIEVTAHCQVSDNAYYYRNILGGVLFGEGVCLGDSSRIAGVSYSDDAQVIVHEIQHGVTVSNYSPSVELNAFANGYDEAGALNEGLSDFMSAIFVDSQGILKEAMDPRLFSRWALGTYALPSQNFRGAHQCPQYEASYPTCSAFPEFSTAQSQIHVSYTYPDGLGWPFWSPDLGSSSRGRGKLDSYSMIANVFRNYRAQQEIHGNSVLLFGALWDAYFALKQLHAVPKDEFIRAVSGWVMEAVRHLPLPNSTTNRSPVTFVGFVDQLMEGMEQVDFFTEDDRKAVVQAFKDRGLYKFKKLKKKWLDAGPGTSFLRPETSTPGIWIQDDPTVLKSWLIRMGSDEAIVSQGLSTGYNKKADPGEVIALWFDLKNLDPLTAGGVLLTVSSLSPEIEILDSSVNIGYLTQASVPSAQVMYHKVNGSEIVTAFTPPGTIDMGMGSTYFTTDPNFYTNSRTAVWVRISPAAVHGTIARLRVQAQPTNGPIDELEFWVVVQ